ncbi:MAG: amidohydrolase [Chloroflexi bacterium]|nr:amidohydrolase [Chloroflexota bacterium]
MATTELAGKRAKEESISFVDADVHPHFRQGLRDLMPYLSDAWRKRVGLGAAESWTKGLPASEFTLPTNRLYLHTKGALRLDAVGPDGSPPASDPKLVREQLLDRFNISAAVLIGGNMFGLGGVPDADLAAALATAYNDYMLDTWLPVDSRYKLALYVAPQDPVLAAKEIDRLGERPGVVAVYLPLINILMGNRHFYPVYEAATRHGLPVMVHPNSIDGQLVAGARMVGIPSYYIEWHAGLSTIFMANAASLVCEGVYERFPGLKTVFCEGGLSWVPHLMWRLDKNWKALRDEVPWLKRRPSEYMLEHMRFSTQPIEEPERPEYLLQILEMMHAERTVIFSSDFPHWDADDPFWALAKLPDQLKRRIAHETARELFGL